jgi:hypothetical protein
VSLALKEIAWNRIRLSVPAHWEIAFIGERQLTFQEGLKAALEIKWRTVTGKFSHRSHIKRLSAQHKGKLKQPIDSCPLPNEWEKALKTFSISGFAWDADNISGRGGILFCPVCRTATLIQFFFHAGDSSDRLPVAVLQTYRDHRHDGVTDWRVFDICATLPERFMLTDHRFHPGKYVLAFSDKTHRIQLLRWAPASVLLRDQTLAQFAGSWAQDLHRAFAETTINGCRGVEWKRSAPTKLNRWRPRLFSAPLFQLMRIWHLERQNRIFGVTIDGKIPIDPELVSDVCGMYDSL